MRSFFRRVEEWVYARLRREPPQGKWHRAAFWLLIVYLLLGIGRLLPGAADFSSGASSLVLLALIVCCIPLTWRWVFARLLWKLRNRLIVTYLLMGLAPVLLLLTLGGIAAYMFAGQFASFAATSEIDKELAHIEAENRAFAVHIAHVVADDPRATSVTLPALVDPDPLHEHVGLEVAAFEDGKPIAISGAKAEEANAKPAGEANGFEHPSNISAVPGWVSNGYRGIVYDSNWLYLRAVDSETIGGHKIVVVSSLPLRKDNVDQFARGLGSISIFPHVGIEDSNSSGGTTGATGSQRAAAGAGQNDGGFHLEFGKPSNSVVKINDEDAVEVEKRSNVVNGGELPPAAHFYDWAVEFLAPIQARQWKDGSDHASFIHVVSRPTLLYQRLVVSSLRIAVVMEEILITIGIFFALLELVAFLMAMRLNRTITRSISDLYIATQEVDSGNFSHRIAVTRKDQLAALSVSFNEMTASIEELLEQQREKERLQNELEIAQEVQANLFPQGNVSLRMLELHGVCRPARTVSGDYYDFLVFSDTSLGIALGDISGKGISAALLMATLHSAVRAYRFAGEELVTTGTEAAFSTSVSGRAGDGAATGVVGGEARAESPESALVAAGPLAGNHMDETECADLFESPSRVLALLNRHLYRSTQPEKYATLFLAFYDGLTSKLTYSNGGQLPPILLCRDGSQERLDCGGTVVGLLEGMNYEQGTVTMKAGDILVAYSDGVTEPENEFGDFGEERLLELVRRHQHLSLADISDKVMQALRSWIGAEEQPDDITLVLARQL
jgi:sigma-B regulation protein RsbU (phosphoserine phosphatase)